MSFLPFDAGASVANAAENKALSEELEASLASQPDPGVFVDPPDTPKR